MADEQNQESGAKKKQEHVTLRDLTASKEARVIGGARGKPHAKLRNLTASKDVHIIRDSGR
jgi:hypothetical protein